MKQRAEEKELELHNEIDRLRKEKRDLDAKVNGAVSARIFLIPMPFYVVLLVAPAPHI